MPLYEYECPQCGLFERMQKFSDPVLTACPTCQKPVEKLLSAPAIQFKGTGWYVTDYSGKSSGGKDKDAKGSESKSSSDSGKGEKGNEGAVKAKDGGSDKGKSSAKSDGDTTKSSGSAKGSSSDKK